MTWTTIHFPSTWNPDRLTDAQIATAIRALFALDDPPAPAPDSKPAGNDRVELFAGASCKPGPDRDLAF